MGPFRKNRSEIAVISPNQSSRHIFAIVISEKGGAERREVYDRPEISVGRVQVNDLMLPKGNVSKRHARLIFRDGRFIVTDLNSTNGTYVNRRRISQATIVREGDRIYIGDFVLRIELPEGTSEPSTGGGSGDPPREQTGSGPVPVPAPAPRPPALSEGGPTGFPGERELEDANASYPEVPGPPRMPSGARHESFSDSRPSEKLPLASVVDVSHADIDLRQLQATAEDPQQRNHRQALAALTQRVLSVVPETEIEGQLDETTRARIERTIEERAHELRSQGEIAPEVDLNRVIQDARAELLELGPLGPILVDPSVIEIVAMRYDAVSALRGGRHVAVEPGFSSEDAMRRVIARMCRAAGAPLSPREGAVVRRLRDGSRLWAATGTSAPDGLVIIQKSRKVGASLEELVRSGTISRAIATFLGQAVSAHLNILVVGPRDPGTSAIVAALAAAATDVRLIVMHELDDVTPPNEGVVRLGLPGDPEEAASLTRVAARIPAARMVVELVAPEVSAAVVDAIGEGSAGVVASLHGASLRRSLARLAVDVASARVGTPQAGGREAVAASFDVAVEVGRLRDTRLRVMRVSELAGTTADEIRTLDIFNFNVERTAAGGAIEGTFNASGHVPRCAEEIIARGFALDSSLFTRPPSR